jgi:hypothetical protein
MTDETIDHFALFIYAIQKFKSLFSRNHSFASRFEHSYLPARVASITDRTFYFRISQTIDCIWLQNTQFHCSTSSWCFARWHLSTLTASVCDAHSFLTVVVLEVQPWRGSFRSALDGGLDENRSTHLGWSKAIDFRQSIDGETLHEPKLLISYIK